MRIRTNLRRALITLLACAHISACGLLLYPERKGQSGGRIDPTVAILDGVGCLFFLIPGLIAFAVDFHHGTIYLPGGAGPRLLTENDWQVLPVDREQLTPAGIEKLLNAHSDVSLSVADPRWDVLRADDIRAFAALRALAESRDGQTPG